MARQQKNTVDYFPHPVKHGKGMFFIRQKYGNDGYAAWFILLEKLGAADYHYLDLNNDIDRLYLTAEIAVNETILIEIINDLVTLEHVDRELWERERIVFDQKFVESIQDAYKKRLTTIVNINTLIEYLNAKGRTKLDFRGEYVPGNDVNGSGNTQTKLKETKQNENIYRAFAHLKITNDEYQNLIGSGYAPKSINDILDRIENYKQNTKYKSLYLTAKNWLQKETKNVPEGRREKYDLPPGFGEPSPTAITREEFMKNKNRK